MSHVVTIKTALNSLDTIRAAVERLGGTLAQAETYRWYGTSVGDYPVPAGFTREELGRCHYAASFPGCTYQVGIIDLHALPASHPARAAYKGRYVVQYDYYQRALADVMGKEGAPRFSQAYAVEAAKAQARRKGQSVTESARADGSIVVEIRAR